MAVIIGDPPPIEAARYATIATGGMIDEVTFK
jgi:hypothetical protein